MTQGVFANWTVASSLLEHPLAGRQISEFLARLLLLIESLQLWIKQLGCALAYDHHHHARVQKVTSSCEIPRGLANSNEKIAKSRGNSWIRVKTRAFL